jgi:hypothetical protein
MRQIMQGFMICVMRVGAIKAVNPTVKWKLMKAAFVAVFLYFGK